MANLQLQDFPGSSRTLISIAILPFLLINIPVSCSKQTVPSITVQELHQMVGTGEDIFLLDVRTEREFSANRLSFADLRAPHDSLSAYLDQLPQDKNTGIYCFCRSGRRSALATRYLIDQGYLNVYNVAGGILDWQENGFETVGDQPPSDSTDSQLAPDSST